ncbi:peptidase S8/S53 domain-containing protein [Trichoderma afarasin]
MASSSVLDDALDSIPLLITASESIMGAARILWKHETNGDLKSSYSNVKSLCFTVNSHWKHVSDMANGIDADLIHRTLNQLESIIAPEVLDLRLYKTCLNAPRYEKLRAFNRRWERIQKRCNNDTTIQYIKSYMEFGTNAEERDQLFQLLDEWQEELRVRSPENQPGWAFKELSTNTSVGSSSIAVWNAVQSIFKAFVACSNCKCIPTHDIMARLRLGTYRKNNIRREGDTDECLDFDMLLSMRQSWTEAHVSMVNEIKARAVQIQNSVPIGQNRGQKKSTKIKQMRVKQLCELIEKIKIAALRLKLKVTGDQIFKLQSEKSTFLGDKAKGPVTLDKCLRSHSLTDRTRRILAVMLSYAVLYLHDTPWLQPTWSSSHVLFFPTASSAIPLQPFIQTHLASPYESSQDSCADPDDLDPDWLHHCPHLVTLAVILMELYLGAPFDTLARRYIEEPEGGTQSSTYPRSFVFVNEVFEACKAQVHDSYQFHYVVEKCLDPTSWEDEDGNKLDNQTLMSKIYQEIVKPLETELYQSFEKISSDDLDDFAKGIDIDLHHPSIKIAILDTGIDMQHPDIDAQVEQIKDRYNWLNENRDANVRVVTDRSGHGTFTARLILDYARDSQLYVAKIADDTPSKPSVVAKAINHAVSTWEVDIISMSFGFTTCDMDDYHELEDALANAHAKRVLLFAAASNSGGKQGRAYPARDQNVIAIHATDTDGNRSKFSPTALSHDINLATVGEAIESAWPTYLPGNSDSKFLRCKSGTSYATPIAAGIAGFLLLYTKINLPDKADGLKSRRRMQALLKRVAEKEVGQTARDGYHFIALSLHRDSLFGKGKHYIDETIRDVLNT